MINTIVFDFDGTIANTINEILNIFNETSFKFGFGKIDKSHITLLRNKGAAWILSNLKIPSYQVPIILNDIKKGLSKNIPDSKPVTGMPKTILALKSKGIRLGILTTNSENNVKKFLKLNHIDEFDFIYHGSSLFGKDYLLKKMLREQKLNINTTFYVGDEDRDIVAAHKVGIKIIAVTWGLNTKKLIAKNKPDHIASKPVDILKFIN